MKPKLVISSKAESADLMLGFYNQQGEQVGSKRMTGEDMEALEFYGVDFDTLQEGETLDLVDVLEEAGGAWDDLSSFTELAFKAVK